jgi:hypothetical protein
VEVFDDVSERNSVVKTSSRLSKRKSMSHLEMRSASRAVPGGTFGMEMCVDFSGLTAPSIPSSVCFVALLSI